MFVCVCVFACIWKGLTAKYAVIHKRTQIFEINKRKYKASLKDDIRRVGVMCVCVCMCVYGTVCVTVCVCVGISLALLRCISPQLGLINRLWHLPVSFATNSLVNKMASVVFPFSHKIAKVSTAFVGECVCGWERIYKLAVYVCVCLCV